MRVGPKLRAGFMLAPVSEMATAGVDGGAGHDGDGKAVCQGDADELSAGAVMDREDTNEAKCKCSDEFGNERGGQANGHGTSSVGGLYRKWLIRQKLGN